MKEQPKLSKEEWTEVRKLKASRSTGWEYFQNLVKTIYQELGEEKTCQIMSMFMADNARRYVEPGMRLFGLQGKDPWTVASYFKLATGDIIGYDARLVQESPQRVLYQLYPPCIWFPKLDIPARICQSMSSFEQTAVQLINPRIKTYATKFMTAGDPYCEIVFEEQ